MFKVGQQISLEFLENMEFIVIRHMEGGMSDVYKVVQSNFNSKYFGIKMLKQHLDITKFKKECEIWTFLSTHPSCTKPFAYGMAAGFPAIAYPWYPNSLAEIDPKGWKTHEVANLVDSLVSFFEYAVHDLKIFHCDIKPQNILIDKDRKPYVTDFGISKVILSCSQNKTSSSVGGTREYMAPELQFGIDHNAKSELYSFGITIFEFLTGEHPYLNEWDSKRNESRNIRHFKELKKRFGAHLERHLDFIQKCISIDPNKRPERFQSVGSHYNSDLQIRSKCDSVAINALVMRAQFHRKEGDLGKSEEILHDALRKYGRNPVLLNGLGVTYIESRSRAAAVVPLEEAARIVLDSKGIWESYEYFAPVMNLSIQYRCLKRLNDAFLLLCEAWEVFKNQKMAWFKYSEFGWMMLYEGNFSESCEFMSKCFNGRTIGPFEMLCFTDAAALSSSIEKYANQILSKVEYTSQFDVVYFLCAFLLAKYSEPQEMDRLQSAISCELTSEIEALEIEMRLPKYGLRPPFNRENELVVICSIDEFATKGKYHSLLREIEDSH